MGDLADFWNMLRGKTRARPDGEKGIVIATWPFDAATVQRSTTASAPDTSTSALQSVMLTNELVFACLGAKATAAQDPILRVERQVVRDGAPTWETDDRHIVRQLLARPNPFLSEADLMQAAIVSWDTSNPRRFFCEKVYERGALVSLYPLNPACMRPRYSRTSSRQLIGYDWIGEERKEYGLDDLIIRSAPSWYDPPPLAAALGSVASDSAQTDYVSAFFQNGGMPSGFLKYKTMALNDEKRDEIRSRWRAIYGNARRGQHDIGVLDMNADWVRSGVALDELDSETLRQVAESRICMVFGVPPLIVYAYVGLVRATYSNLKEAWASFWDATMSPALKEWRDFWTWALLAEAEGEDAVRAGRVRLTYDLSQVAALQEDVDARQNRARLNFAAGGITLNEFRAEIGAAPDPSGDYYVRSAVAQPVPAGSGETMPALATRRRKARDDEQVRAIERRMERALRDYLAGEYRAAAAAVREGS